MSRFTLLVFTILLLLSDAVCGQETPAWEVALESEIALKAAVVRLGDIGRINGLAKADAEVLERIVLAPGPSRSYTRSLSPSQIRKILQARGVELDSCHFTGASRCLIVYDAAAPRLSAPAINSSETSSPSTRDPWSLVRPASYRSRGGPSMIDSVKQELAHAVNARLVELSGEPRPWQVDITLPTRAIGEVPQRWEDLTLEGLDAVAEGRHQAVACFTSDAGDVRVPIEAVATRMVELVVPVRPLKRGDVVTSDDVELRYVAARTDSDQAVRRIDAVVGQQVQLPVRVGEPLRARSLKRPVLVKRRETVDVLARRGSITVRTKVRAIDDGAMGDIITVERLENGKSRFLARVVGVQRVEVCASNATAQRVAER